jgi:hypothetical protein
MWDSVQSESSKGVFCLVYLPEHDEVTAGMKSDSLNHSVTRIWYVYLLICSIFRLWKLRANELKVHQFYVLPTQCIYVFCVDLRTNSDYFRIQHLLTGFYNIDLTLCSPVVTICTASLTFNNSTFCPYSVFVCFVWISEQTTIISLYSINWLVFITETGSVYCAVRTESLYTSTLTFNRRPRRLMAPPPLRSQHQQSANNARYIAVSSYPPTHTVTMPCARNGSRLSLRNASSLSA